MTWGNAVTLLLTGNLVGQFVTKKASATKPLLGPMRRHVRCGEVTRLMAGATRWKEARGTALWILRNRFGAVTSRRRRGHTAFG